MSKRRANEMTYLTTTIGLLIVAYALATALITGLAQGIYERRNRRALAKLERKLAGEAPKKKEPSSK